MRGWLLKDIKGARVLLDVDHAVVRKGWHWNRNRHWDWHWNWDRHLMTRLMTLLFLPAFVV